MVIKLKNKFWIILILIFVLGLIGYFYLTKNNNKNKSANYNTSKTSSSTNEINTKSNTDNNKNTTNTTNEAPKTQAKEELISSFSTKIYNKESARQNNVNITCSKLNNTVVANGATFSFCNTVGQATSSKGYQKADIFDKNGNKKKGLGGGNCQVSSTLYNAILNIPSLKITERHAHSNKVPYIQTGKDAAVAYGSYDLKFVNNSGSDIKITSEATASDVNINVYKIVY